LKTARAVSRLSGIERQITRIWKIINSLELKDQRWRERLQKLYRLREMEGRKVHA